MSEQHQVTDFDKLPPIPVGEYDRIVPLSQPGYDYLFLMAQSLLQTRLPQTDAHLLIVGVGSGKELVTFGEANSNWTLQGVDPSKAMLELARQKIEEHGLTDRVNLFQGFTYELPPAAMYDAASCVLVCQFLPDNGAKLALFQSIAQRLKPGACFILGDLFGEKATDDFKLLLAAWKQYHLLVGFDAEWIKNTLEGVLLDKMLHLVSEQRFIELLEEAGFEKVVRFYTGLLLGGWIAFKK
jgi:tRNA (cmo5U34)-methyltransferase